MSSIQINKLGALCFFAIIFFNQASFADDIDSLKTRLVKEYLNGNGLAYGTIPDSAAIYLSQQQINGKWFDINYTETPTSVWSPMKHLWRLLSMAVAFNHSDSPTYKDTALLRGIIAGLDYWYANDGITIYNNAGESWYPDVGKPLVMGPLLLMMEARLDPALIQTGSNMMNVPSMTVAWGTITGQNMIWIAEQTIWRGCLRKSLSDVNLGMNAIKNEIQITTGDGIQPDFSFHQHDAQLYNGGYGVGFMQDVTFWVLMAQGLSFAFNTEKINILTGLILDGSRWMICHNDWDFSCGGREITRQGWGKLGQMFKSNLMRMQTSRLAEQQAFVDYTNGLNDSAFAGDKHFWCSDYHVRRTKDYNFSIRMCSFRTGGSEGQHGLENRKNSFVAFGANTILRKGDEYFGIYPLWDWCRIPGVTAPQPNPQYVDGWYRGTTAFVGGVSDGKHGAVGFDLNWAGVSGRKAWFCFNDEVAALGAGITCGENSPVYTSINQCWLRGSVWTANDTGQGNTVANGLRTLDQPRWVFHDSVGYVFPHPAQVTLKNETQSGSWNSINTQYSGAVVTGDVFSLWFDHGLNPIGAGYEYIVVPGKSKEDIKAYSQHIPVHTLVNTADIQAVRHDSLGVTGIVFYTAGSVDVREGLTLEVDKPCIVLLDESGLKYQVSVSNPMNEALSVNVNLVFNNGQHENMLFSLPDDGAGSAGKSVTKTSTASTGGVKNEPAVRASEYLVLASFPNPFNPSARISYYLPQRADVSLRLYNLQGKIVRELADGMMSEGKHTVQVEAGKLAPGIYICELKMGATAKRIKLVLLK